MTHGARRVGPRALVLWAIVSMIWLAAAGCGGGGGGGSVGGGTNTGMTTGSGTTGTLPIGDGGTGGTTTKKDTERTYQTTANQALQGRALASAKGVPSGVRLLPLGTPMVKPANLKTVATSKEVYQGTLTQGAWYAYYQVGGSENVVPAGTEVTVSLTGPANADFDLYIKAGDLPTTSSYDDRGFSPTSTERVHCITEQASRVYVLVVAYAGVGDYSLTCDQGVSLPQATTVTLANNAGTATGNLAGNGSYSRFVVPAVPDGARLAVTMTGPDGTDFDLFARVGSPPTFRIADAIAVGNTSSETLRVTNRSGAARDVYVTVLSASGAGDFNLQFTLVPAPVSEVTDLVPGTPATGTLAGHGSYRVYRIPSVPADSQLAVDLQGPATADFDLFVRMGAVPTWCAMDAIGMSPTSTEHCVMRTGSQVQDAYVLVRSFRGDGEFTLSATISANPTEGGPITPGTPAVGNLGGDGAQVYYYVADVAPGSYLSAHLVGLQTSQNADFDVYVRLNQPPTVNDYDARGAAQGFVENVSLTVPGTDPVKAYFMVRSYRGSGTYALLVDSPAPAATDITVPTMATVTTVDGTLSGSGDSKLYRVPAVPDQGATLVFDLAAPNAAGSDFDLFARRGAPPTALQFDAMGMSATSTEHCVVTTSQPNQDVFIRVRSHVGAGAFTLTARRVNAAVIPITLGDPVIGTLGQTGDSYMYVARAVPANTTVTAQMVGLSGDFDLYMRKGAAPTLDLYDARGSTPGSIESVSTVVSTETDVYIWVRSALGSGDFALVTGPANVNSGSSGTTLLSSGVPVTGTLDAQLAERQFRIDVPANTILDVALTPGLNPAPGAGADFDLYVRRGDAPTTALYDTVGFSPTCLESCRVSVDTAQTVYIMVKSYAGTGSFNLVATATPVVVTPPPAGAGRTFLMTIGINDYPGTANDLSWCVKDADDLRMALPAVPTGQGAHLRNSEATKAAIQQKLLDMKNGTNGMTQIGSADTLVLTYSGHGSNSGGLGYIVVWGNNAFDFISSTELETWLGDLPVDTKKIVLLDSCFSGLFIGRSTVGDARFRYVPMKGSDRSFAGSFFRSRSTRTRTIDALGNLVGLMASAGGEYSMESGSLQNGAYTHYMVQGLGATSGVYGPADANSNHSITVSEASAYATPKVTAAFASQHPQYWDASGAYASWVLKY